MISIGRKIVIIVLMISMQIISGNAFAKPHVDRFSGQIVSTLEANEIRPSPENKILAASDADHHCRSLQPFTYGDSNDHKASEKLAFIWSAPTRLKSQYYLISYPPKL